MVVRWTAAGCARGVPYSACRGAPMPRVPNSEPSDGSGSRGAGTKHPSQTVPARRSSSIARFSSSIPRRCVDCQARRTTISTLRCWILAVADGTSNRAAVPLQGKPVPPNDKEPYETGQGSVRAHDEKEMRRQATSHDRVKEDLEVLLFFLWTGRRTTRARCTAYYGERDFNDLVHCVKGGQQLRVTAGAAVLLVKKAVDREVVDQATGIITH